MKKSVSDNIRPDFDKEMQDIAEYVIHEKIVSDKAYEAALYCLMDSLGCAMLALNYPACEKLLGPIVPHEKAKRGVRVPGTQYRLDPVQGAFNIGTMIRWVDFNDAFLASEWNHPTDNIGGILAVADYLAQLDQMLTIKDVLTNMIKAHEIQGVMALQNSFNSVGLDHTVLIKLATAAVTTHMLGGDKEKICNVQSQVWVDGQHLRTYRHAPNTGSRKSWAAGDATSRGVFLSLLTMRGEMGYPSALTAKKWGFYDVYFGGKPFKFDQPYKSYVMEHVIFKFVPAEIHAQTAIEAAFQLHDKVKDKLDSIKKITIRTQAAAYKIISKQGPLYNPADRDHCIEYMVAIGLIFGELTADHYEDNIANDPRIDILREKTEVYEDEQFSKDYLDPDKRSIANALQIFFKDGSKTDEIVIEYPIGHPRRREEGFPMLEEKFKKNLSSRFSKEKMLGIINLFRDHQRLLEMPVDEFMKIWI